MTDVLPAVGSLARASQEWKSALIDVSGTNRLLHFKRTSTTLDLSAIAERGLVRLLRGEGVLVRELFPAGTDTDRALRAAAALHRKQREATEEYGVSVTYLALGFATWDPEANRALTQAEAEETGAESTARVRRGPTPNAPVLLRPVEIARRRGITDEWEIRLVDDFQLNGVLLHVLNFDRNRVTEDTALEPAGEFDRATRRSEADETLETVLGILRAACADVTGFGTTRDLLIGTFSYQKQPMVSDVANLAALQQSDLAAALAGDPEAAARVRAVARETEVNESDPDYSPVDSEYLVLDADASQSYVVNAALAGRNLVVQGPPGTGKSQTIANVIAALVADGKHVLFVAQKRAAITAVLDRLQSADLSHLLLDLFAADGSRRVIAEQLRTVLDRQQQIGEPNTAHLHSQLASSRDRLVRHKDALFARTHGWGVSIHEMRVASLESAPHARTSLRLPSSTFNTWDHSTLATSQTDIDELGRLGALTPGWETRAGWSPAAMTSPEAAERLRQVALELRWTTLPALQPHLENAARTSGHSTPHNLAEAEALVSIHRDASRVSAVSPDLLNGADIDGMLAATSKAHRRELRDITWTRRRAGKKAVNTLLPTSTAEGRIGHLLTARAVRAAWGAAPTVTPYGGAHELAESFEAAKAAIAELDHAVQGMSLRTAPLAGLEPTLESLLADARTPQMVRAHHLKNALATRGLAPVVAMIRSRAATGELGTATPSELLRWVCVRSVLEASELSSPAVAGIRGDVLTDATRSFQDLDKSHLKANAARVRRRAAGYLKKAFDSYPDQHSALKTEVTRKRNFRPVRRLFDEVPNVLLAAKPVWAMSPLQVSRILPATQCFDVVIFDEASQVKPADAIPALIRGRQAIVAGDSRQLPPTEFFSKVLEDEEEPEEDTALDSGAEAEAKPARPRSSYTRDAESILFAMDRLLAGQSRSLQWHYRSYDERLIAVSNEYVYDGSLTTFPAPDALESIRHEVVPYSPGIGAGTNSPELEVRRIVELVRQQVVDHPGESVGVIAFGIKHEARIERALELAMQQDPEFERALNANTDEPWFVKAIERVQGDERDAIFLSVGYGKSADGKLRYFWGPLLKEGGERRLNVAISRAKKRMTLVTSFSKDDVPADGHSSAGYRLMYNFVRFMATAGRDLADGAPRAVGLNPFEIDIKRRLEQAGLALDCQVGVGGYRLDFAVRHPDYPGRHVLAIEADGAAYHSGHTARERDRLRQELLERRGWIFHRIWSTDWFNNADQEVERVIRAYETALRRDAVDMVLPIRSEPTSVWHEGTTERKRPRPLFARQDKITDYSMSVLIELVRYVRSDDVLRSREEEMRLLMKELGYSRLGSKIQDALTRAQEFA